MSAIAISGASGYLGSHVAAGLLAATDAALVLPVRAHHTRETVVGAIAAELEAQGRPASARDLARIITVPLPPPQAMAELLPALSRHGVTEIVHAAGCLSYFNAAKLRAGNVELTRAWLELGGRLGVDRFTYLSTGFSSGYVDGPIPEALHGEPERDPNDYTRSKRQTERLVAASDVPWVIVRPSIVIGDSRDGRYAGKPYGVYQIWTGLARFFTDRPRRLIHAVAAAVPLNVIHQDAFRLGFLAVHGQATAGDVIHLSAALHGGTPTTRDYWRPFLALCARPDAVRWFDSPAGLPMDDLDENERLMVELAHSNMEISSRPWPFETGWLDRHRVSLPQVTFQTIATAMRAFLARTPQAVAFAASLC